MDTEIFLINNAGNGQRIKRIHEHIENLLTVLIVAFLLKIIEIGHDTRFVIASQQDDIFGCSDFH